MKKTVGSGVGVLVAVMLAAAVPGLSGQEGPDVTGTWDLALEGAFAAQSWTLEVSRADGALAATLVMGQMGAAPLREVTLTGSTLSGEFTADMHGQRMTVVVTTTFEGAACKGSASGFPMGDITYRGTRRPG